MDLIKDPQQLQEQTQHLVTAATTWAAEMHNTLAGIKGNTNQVFFWSMFAGLGVAVTATLWTLNRLHEQLRELNHHQIVYREMWLDERDHMHNQMRETEEFQDEALQKTQQQWSMGEKSKRNIMQQMLRNQEDLAKVLAGDAATATARGAARQALIPRRGEPGHEEFRENLTDLAQAMYMARGRGDRGSGSNSGLDDARYVRGGQAFHGRPRSPIDLE
ncbi:hypothetical protein PG985_000704 [Apiospora marii]|uniref:SMODS and SLOG-associating 2TM effector domain-containing protein n=1 Tax=Apiospora marii TaxID=335849 RepID=A0ABR1R4C4_9PEZI